MINRTENLLDVIVEDDQLSLAIGKRGQNVRLAAMLTGWRVNIISKTKLQEKIKFAVQNLLQLTGINEAVAQVLVQGGIMSIVDLSATAPEEISRIAGMNSVDAKNIIANASSAVEKGEISLEAEASEEIVSASAVPGQSGFQQSNRGQAQAGNVENNKFSEAERRIEFKKIPYSRL
jgi:N utilization substance protein A